MAKSASVKRPVESVQAWFAPEKGDRYVTRAELQFFLDRFAAAQKLTRAPWYRRLARWLQALPDRLLP